MNKRIVIAFSLSLLITVNYLRSMEQAATPADQISLARVGEFILKSRLNIDAVKKCLINRDSEYSREVSQLAKKLKNLRYEFGDIQNTENMYKESSTFQQITLWSALLFLSGNHILQLASSRVKKFWEEDPRILNIVDLGFIVFSLLSWGDRCVRSEQLEQYRNALNDTASLQALEPFYSKKNSINANTKPVKDAQIPLIAVGKFIRESSSDINELQECLIDRNSGYKEELKKIERKTYSSYEQVNLQKFEAKLKESRFAQNIFFWGTLAVMTGNRTLSLVSPQMRKALDPYHKAIKGIELGLIAINLLFYFDHMRLDDYKKDLDDKESLKVLKPFYNKQNISGN